MFFYVSKIIGFLFTPIIWVFSLLVYALVTKNTPRRKKLLIWGVAVFYFFSNSFILEEFSRAWEVPAVHYEELKVYDAGIVLGGILSYDEQFDRIQFYRSSDRLFQAVELYKKGFIKKIFFVGGSGSIEFADLKEGRFVKRYLLTLGIPEEDILIENESKNTRENAVNAKDVLIKNNMSSGKFLLITSGLHMRRALGCFKVMGLDVMPYSVDRNGGPLRRFTPDHLLIPDVDTFMWWDAVIHEWIGMAVYKMRGYA